MSLECFDFVADLLKGTNQKRKAIIAMVKYTFIRYSRRPVVIVVLRYGGKK